MLSNGHPPYRNLSEKKYKPLSAMLLAPSNLRNILGILVHTAAVIQI